MLRGKKRWESLTFELPRTCQLIPCPELLPRQKLTRVHVWNETSHSSSGWRKQATSPKKPGETTLINHSVWIYWVWFLMQLNLKNWRESENANAALRSTFCLITIIDYFLVHLTSFRALTICHGWYNTFYMECPHFHPTSLRERSC